MDLPPYLDLPGSATYPQPFQFTGVNQQVFFLRASRDRLKIVTDRWLNAVPNSEYRFEPLLPFVVCSPAWFDRITSPGATGWMHESEIDFAYFVTCFRNGEIDHVGVVFPYLLVDNARTVTEGREIYGYRKVYAQMEYVAGTWQPGAASTWVFPTDAPDEEWQLREVVRILTPPLYAHAVRDAKWEDLNAVAGEVAEGAIDEAMMLLLKTLRNQYLANYYVLQVRDVQYPQSAGYQALIEAPMQIAPGGTFRLLPPGFAIKVTDYPSYPILSDLGIEVDENNVAQSLMSYQTFYDAVVQPGTVLAVGGRTTKS